jgi:mannitol/fructose-specific phosphotransferase system IIA component (Ntr-type)
MHRLLMDREELMTTGVRRGFAFPHAFDPRVKESFLSLGVVPEGLDYASLDGQPVQFIFMLLGPPGNQAVHLRILARVSRLTSQSDVFHLLSEATDPQALIEVIRDSEQQLKTSPYVFPDSRE